MVAKTQLLRPTECCLLLSYKNSLLHFSIHYIDNVYIFVVYYSYNTQKGVNAMSQTLVSFRMDENLKKAMELTCQELGMNMTTAFTIFAKKMCREKRISFFQ